MRLPFAITYARERSAPLSSQRVLNLFAHEAPRDAKTPVALYSTPGLEPIGDEIDAAPVRGLIVTHEYLFVVAGSSLYRVDNAGNKTSLGTVDGTGPVFMEANDAGQIMIVTEGNVGYIATIATVTEIADTDFPGASSVTHLDGYFIIAAPDSQQFYISGLRDGTMWDALDFASAEGSSSHIHRVFADHRELWIFGHDATEVWYNSGAADFPFERVNGASITKGCLASHSVVSLDNSIFWLAEDGIVYRANGYTPVRVSTHAIEHLISQMPNRTAARAFAYTDEGHAFYVLTFPGQATIVYDVPTGLWHERQTMGRMDWAVIGYARAFGRHVTGGFTNGHIYSIERALLTEDGASIRRQAVTPTIWAETERFTTSRIQIDFEVGTGARRTYTDNLLRFSERFGETLAGAGWGVANASITADAVADPLRGEQVADKLVENTANSTHGVAQQISKDAAVRTYTVSVYAKAAERTKIRLALEFDGSNRARCIFDLSTGTAQTAGVDGSFTNPVATIESIGSGWYRCAVTGDTGTESIVKHSINLVTGTSVTTYTGDGTSGAYIFGAQLEAKAAASTYRPTAATPAETIEDIEPQAMLDWSDNGGKTWGHERWASIGKVGKYEHRAQWRRLGQARQRIYRCTVTDPVVTTILGMYGEIVGGKI